MNTEKVKFEITTKTILKIILAIFLVWFLYAVRDVVVLFFVVLVIFAALNPLVDRMGNYIPRILALFLLLLIFILILVAVGFLLAPLIISQVHQLAINLPVLIERFGPLYQQIQPSITNYQENLFKYSSQVGQLTSGVFSTTVGFISGVVGVFTILVLSFYMLLEKDSIKKLLNDFVPLEHKERIFDLLRKIAEKMGKWLRGQALLMLVVGVADFIALSILGVPYAAILAILGGLFEVIPYVGPWLGLLPAFIIAFTISPIKALFVLIAYVLIQQLEAQFLAPKIMGRAVGLSPVIIILALLCGASLMGILGVIVAVPVAAAISVIIQEWPEIRKLRGL